MIFAKMYHDKSAPAGSSTHTLFTRDLDPSSPFSFSSCVLFSFFFFFQRKTKGEKTDAEELVSRTQSNAVPLNQEIQG